MSSVIDRTQSLLRDCRNGGTGDFGPLMGEADCLVELDILKFPQGQTSACNQSLPGFWTRDLHGSPCGKPIALDLFCGRGGWTKGLQRAGFYVIGVDIQRFEDYPGDEFILADLRTWSFGRHADFVVASPPCQDFSKWNMRCWFPNPPMPSMELVEASKRIAGEIGCAFVLENVRGAQYFLGSAAGHYGPFYLWGGVPALLPVFGRRVKYKTVHRSASRRAEIPVELGYHLGSVVRTDLAGK